MLTSKHHTIEGKDGGTGFFRMESDGHFFFLSIHPGTCAFSNFSPFLRSANLLFLFFLFEREMYLELAYFLP